MASERSDFEDQEMTCVECGGHFTWTAGEQRFFRDKGFEHPPKRCRPCKQARKDRMAEYDR